MTISTRQADQIITSGKPVRMTDTFGDSSIVRFITRDRRSVEYVAIASGRTGKMDRSDIAMVAAPS